MNGFSKNLGIAMAISMALASVSMADTSANTTVSATLPVLNSVTTNGGVTSANISVESGQLSTTMSPNFKSFTNNSEGVLVQFEVKTTDSNNASVDAVSGSNNSNEGKMVLANTDIKPAQSSINSALSNGNVQPTANPNVIGYKITLTGAQGNNSYNPVFDHGGNAASVTAPSGTTDFSVQISNDSSLLTDTYSQESDLAGAYQATIYCTVSNP